MFVAGAIALAIAAMLGIIIFESFRALRYSSLYIAITYVHLLYSDVQYVCCLLIYCISYAAVTTLKARWYGVS